VQKKFKVPTTIQRFKNILNENGLETIENWKKLSKEIKEKYPDGLKVVLDELSGIFLILLTKNLFLKHQDIEKIL
jgi:hypothetical protein